MRFAKIVFWIAGIWGVLVITPLYFMFELLDVLFAIAYFKTPPPIA